MTTTIEATTGSNMTEQERLQALLELTGTHLMNQGERCMYIDPNSGLENGCCYFGEIVTDEDGEEYQKMCGAAPVLHAERFKAHPDFKQLNEDMIETIWDEHPELLKEEWQFLNDKELRLLINIQLQVHDVPEPEDVTNYRPVFRERLEDLAKEFGLDTFFLKNWD